MKKIIKEECNCEKFFHPIFERTRCERCHKARYDKPTKDKDGNTITIYQRDCYLENFKS